MARLPPLSAPIPQPELWVNASAAGVCEQCGLPVTSDDIFCGECGFVVGPATRATPVGRVPTDTNVIDLREQVVAEETPQPGSARNDIRLPKREPMPEVDGESESHRVTSPPLNTERFVLQFSTGESFTVYGSGLVGRSPKPEPSEYFDDVIRIADASRSVSKTHLEFGQEGGSFWVKDRFSGNGTVVREPESQPTRCHPERRYRLVRGSRVDLGEQFFIVS